MAQLSDGSAPRHPVRVVVARTGLAPDLLRAWERRYGVVAPSRSRGRHRLYSDDDVERLRLLADLTSRGQRIRHLAPLTLETLRARTSQNPRRKRPDRSPAAHAPRPPSQALAAAMRAVEDFDAPALELALRTASARIGPDDMIDTLMVPLLRAIGDAWHRGVLTPANEHLASAAARATLTWIRERVALPEAAPRIAVATPQGQLHELGALLVAATATTRGWRVVYLGANLPTSDILSAARRADCTTIALSIVYPAADPTLRSGLRSMVKAMPRSLALLIGGGAAPSYGAAVGRRGTLFTDLSALRAWLDRRAGTRASLQSKHVRV
jgi:methanogenic corrinoid protein MtbC1